MKTTTHYPDDVDEITASGLTPESCKYVSAPRVKECYAHYECRLDWFKPLEEELPVNNLVLGSIVNAVVDEDFLLHEVQENYKKRAIPFHFSEFYNHKEKTCSGGEGSGFCQLNVDGFEFS